MSRRVYVCSLLAVFASLSVACGNATRSDGDGDGSADSGADAAQGDAGIDDAGLDLGGPDTGRPDVGMDTTPEDIGVDTTPPDVGMDTTPPDVGIDTTPIDVGVDTSCVDECRVPGPSCEGDLLVTCGPGPDGCLVADRFDCTLEVGTTCDPDTLRCAGDDPIPCSDRETCAAVGRSCDGDTLVVCTRDADGCVVPARVPCDVLDDTCVETDGGASCVAPTDPCIGECPSRAYCDDGGDAVTCAPDADGCLVETSRDACADGGRACVATDSTASCLDSCGGRPTCDPATYAPTCDGAVYRSCFADRDGCLVEQGQNCAFRRGGYCDASEGCLIDLCGDSVIDTDIGERCDDGNRTDGDGCTETCVIEDGWVCAGVPSVCTIVNCGDDRVAFGEGCEDGNTRGGDGCSATCLLELPDRGERVVLDGTLATGDPTWSAPNSDCSEGPTFAVVFDATWWTNDTGSAQSISVAATVPGGFAPELFIFAGDWLPGLEPAGCIAGSPFVGGTGASTITDVTVAAGQSVALIVSNGFGGAPVGNYTLTITAAGCGDSRIQRALGEVCDDGGSDSGDGCSATCALEEGFACRGEPSACYAFTCGDGLVDPDVGESCDDANVDSGDGCSADCTEEDGAFCYGEPSICVNPVCGDDVIDLGEGCEDGNLTNGDGCNDVCQLEVPASGEAVTVEGAFLADSPRFQRPGQGENCSGGFGGSGSFPYQAWTWVNTSDVDVVVDIVAVWPADGFLFVYRGGLNPESPLDQCVLGNDDDGGIRGSALRNVLVTAGSEITIVASTFSASGFTGGFSVTVTAR